MSTDPLVNAIATAASGYIDKDDSRIEACHAPGHSIPISGDITQNVIQALHVMEIILESSPYWSVPAEGSKKERMRILIPACRDIGEKYSVEKEASLVWENIAVLHQRAFHYRRMRSS